MSRAATDPISVDKGDRIAILAPKDNPSGPGMNIACF